MDKLQNLLDRLDKVRRKRKGFTALCPYHAERTPSLVIGVEDGKILLKCFGQGCRAEDIVDKIGLTMADLFIGENDGMNATAPARIIDKGKKFNSIEEIKSGYKTLEDAYEYFKLDATEPSYLQIRYKTDDGKSFATYHKDDDGGWYAGKGDELTPLYNLNEIKDKKSVLIVEGEKVVEILKEYGIPATTSLGGSNAAETANWTPLMSKSVVLWRDNDDAGLKYQTSVNTILRNLNINLRKVEVEKLGLEKGDDLEEFIAKLSGSKESIRGQIYSHFPKVEDNKPTSLLRAHLNKIKSGEIKNWEVPFFPALTKYARAFKPGTQTVIVSAGGVGKSLFIGRMSDELVLSGQARVKRLHLESDLSFYLKRSWSQQAKRTDLMNEEFHFNNPKESDALFDEYEDVLDKIGRTITTSDSGVKKQVTEWSADGVVRWMEQNAVDTDILVIDPISMVLDGNEVWKTSSMLTKKAEELMSKHPQLCVVWIQHTSESPSGGNVGGIAGGKAWNRFSSTILELVAAEPEVYEVLLPNGDITTREIETYVKVKKARNGAASNWKIAMAIDKDDLSYKEIGRMLKKCKG